MWLHAGGDIKKVAACKVRPYELVDTENLQDTQESSKKKVVMLEDGLKDNVTQDDEAVSYVMDMWEENKDWNGMIDEEKDSIGTKYFKILEGNKPYVFLGLCHFYS